MLGSQKDPNDGFDEASSLAGNTYRQYSPLASSSFTTCDDRDGDDDVWRRRLRRITLL